MKKLIGIIGLPCSGKSRTAQMLANEFKGEFISAGALARSLSQGEKDWAETEKNDRYPGEEALRTALSTQIDLALEKSEIVFVDGFPRYGDQVDYMVDTMWLLEPAIIEVSTGDDGILWARAKKRARDTRDTDEFRFSTRLQSAKHSMSDVAAKAQKRLIPHTTIMTGDDQFTVKAFKMFLETMK